LVVDVFWVYVCVCFIVFFFHFLSKIECKIISLYSLGEGWQC
jgi:hypothetical protein